MQHPICLTFELDSDQLANILKKVQAEPDEATLDPRGSQYTHLSKKTQLVFSHADSEQTVSNSALLVCSAYVCYAFGTCLVHVYGWIHA